MKVMKYARGQIWWFENSYSFDGSVQGGKRPAIIISNNKANSYSKNLIVIPCTTQIKRLDMKTHVKFNIEGVGNIALCENLMSANIQKLTEYIGSCDNDLMNKVEKAVQIAIGLCEADEEMQNSEATTIQQPIYTPEPELELASETTQEAVKELETDKPKLGRKPKYTTEDMTRFINDYENHDIQFMMNKYNEVTEKAVTNKVYRFRKILNYGG